MSDIVGLMPEKVRLFWLAMLIGIVTGAAAALLKAIIGLVTRSMHHFELSSVPDWSMLLIPVVGIVLTGIYQRYILRRHISHGVDILVNDLANKQYRLSPKLMYAPMIASSLTLGFGGSAGSEGPIAYTGAAIGSNVGRAFKVDDHLLYILIGCGAGAGIAGIFKAPFGGALFTLEVLGMTLTTVSVIALLTSTISAALTAFVLSGCTMDITWTHNIAFDPKIILPVFALGVFCGLYSVYYSVVMRRMQHTYESMRNPWTRNVVSGLVLAVSVFLFPALYGEGYDVIGRVINDGWQSAFGGSLSEGLVGGQWMLPAILAGILVIKCFACSASNSGGGVAGDFAPTLFAGCIAGLFFSLTANNLFGLGLAPNVFAYIGMAGVMAGVIRAPLMAIFLTAEMCNGFDYLLPLVTVSLISYGMVMAVTHTKFYLVNHHHHHQA